MCTLSHIEEEWKYVHYLRWRQNGNVYIISLRDRMENLMHTLSPKETGWKFIRYSIRRQDVNVYIIPLVLRMQICTLFH
jgi:hypothetical protein